jgi:hypothetical protein
MVSGGKVYPRYRRGGRFFGRRVNCEQVPFLPAWILGRVLADPRAIPYLLVWRSRSDGSVQEAVRVAPYSEPPGPFPIEWTGWVEVKRTDMTRTLVRTISRALPRNSGNVRLALCPNCGSPCRALYAWEVDCWGHYKTSARTSAWKCRACAGLRYASEGGALVFRPRGLLARLGPWPAHERPESWLPEIYHSTEQMAEAGFCG